MNEPLDQVDVTEVEVVRVNPKYPGLLDVRFHLNAKPPEGWDRCFTAPGRVEPGTPNPVTLDEWGKCVTASVTPDALEQVSRHVRARVAVANAAYQQRVLPKVWAQQRRRQKERDERAAMLDDARRRAQRL